MTISDSTPEIVQIQLTQGYVALVDLEDRDLNNYNWIVFIGQSGNNYARRARPKNEFGSQNIHMHRVILERILGRTLLKTEKVDHINNNGIDNRRSNLRLASSMQNSQNQKVSCDSKSGIKGVHYRKDSDAWRARIEIGDKRYSLGSYATAEDAGCIYNYFALEYFGQFAFLNPINDWEKRAQEILNSRTGARRDNTSGFRGVHKSPDGKWLAIIHHNKQTYYVGRFATPDLANAAREEYIKAHFHD